MTRTEILMRMQTREPHSLFYTMELGGSVTQLSKMESEGLITSQRRGRFGRRRDWFLTDEQHSALTFLVA